MKALVVQHQIALLAALRRLSGAPASTLLSLLAIALVLALPCGGWLVLDNLRYLSGNVSRVQQISIFMTVDASKGEVAAIESRLAEARLGAWRFVSKDDALKRLQASEGFKNVVAGLQRNPLPDAFVVEPNDIAPDNIESLSKVFATWPKVAHVQIDSAWVKRFDAMLRIGKLSVALLASLFAVALVVVTFNTIRLQIMTQSAEIEVARLIGATNAFICRPYLYFGAIQGAASGLLASFLVTVCGYLLLPSIRELAELYGSHFSPRGLSIANIALISLASMILGWLGAQLSVIAYLFESAD